MEPVLSENQETRERVESYRRLATAAAFASLFAYAIVLIITQSLNNEVSEHYHTSFSQLGWLAPALMGGFFVAVLVGGHYSDRIGKLPLLMLGCMSMCAGALIFGAAPSFAIAAAGMIVMGIGGGFSEGTASALVTDLYTGPRRASMMNLAQAAFGAGAILVPLATGTLLKMKLDWRLAYYGTAAICFATGLLTLAALLRGVERPVGVHGDGGWRKVLTDPVVLMLSVGIMLYVGAELGQSNWLAVYFRRELHASASFSAKSLSSMWLGILVGRVLGARALKYLSDYALLCWSATLGILAVCALLLVQSPIAGLFATFAVGLFFGPVWPTIVSRAGAAYPTQTGLVTAVVISLGSIGGGLFPRLIGGAADAFGIRSALWMCVFLLMIALSIFLVLRARQGE
jgi:MFS transporter, FHS family, glucose/mannose:H+ symporter